MLPDPRPLVPLPHDPQPLVHLPHGHQHYAPHPPAHPFVPLLLSSAPPPTAPSPPVLPPPVSLHLPPYLQLRDPTPSVDKRAWMREMAMIRACADDLIFVRRIIRRGGGYVQKQTLSPYLSLREE